MKKINRITGISKRYILLVLVILLSIQSFSQNSKNALANQWADSVFNTLTNEQRIAQLMVLRLSEKKKDSVLFYEERVADAIRKYNIGGVVLFQGGPVIQANMLNRLRAITQTPLLVCIDAEWGLGMRMDSVIPLNKQLMLGAINDASLVYEYGRWVGQQCKRAGIQVNFAPVVDVNNNPDNPIINDRSFGEDKYKVALFGIQYMKGLQDEGVLACAKHFPGHGDVSVDSHLDLPVISKSIAGLDSLELYPFRRMFNAGVGSVMVAHLYVPSIDSTPHTATSISYNNVTGLLRKLLGYNGLTFTDALNMKGVAKYFPGGSISAQSLIAGNDLLCLPENAEESISAIKDSIAAGKLSWEDIYQKCRRVLVAKYLYGSATAKKINTLNLTADLNAETNALKRKVSANAITLLNNSDSIFFPLRINRGVAYLAIGINTDNAFAKRMKYDHRADVFYFDKTKQADSIASLIAQLKSRYRAIVIGIHNYARYPLNNFGISNESISLVNGLMDGQCLVVVFGNPYAIKNFCGARNLIACYEDDDITQNTAADLLMGKIPYLGHLPVTVCKEYPFGSGKTFEHLLPVVKAEEAGLNADSLLVVDSLAMNAISQKATPGCVVMVVKNGKVAYEKAFGKYDYSSSSAVSLQTIYDLASITKIAATTLALMRLYDEGKINLSARLSVYLPWLKGSNKQNILIRDVLLHQARLQAGLPFNKKRDSSYFSNHQSDSFSLRVAEGIYINKGWKEKFYQEIKDSRLLPKGRYVYSDLDFILLGQIVENITGQPLDQYVKLNFYQPMGLRTMGFFPGNRFPVSRIAPTELDTFFRKQHILGDVDDPTAALLGGMAGHAGLFSNAEDLAAIMQMLLNEGVFNGKRYIKTGTIALFTSYHSSISRRGYGFDKPEKDNAIREDPYPALHASPFAFGHTGFTGTAAWADPQQHLIYIFLSNRVSPDPDNKKLLELNVRVNILEAIYRAIKNRP